MFKRLLALAAAAAGAALLTPAPASATPTTPPAPGAFCAAADEGATRQTTNHHWYICTQDTHGVRRWTPTTAPSSPTPQPTCTTDGYTRHCPTPTHSTPGYGIHPTPSTSSTPPMHSLPVTSGLSGRLLAGLVTGGVVLILTGTAFLSWKPLRRSRSQHRRTASGLNRSSA